MIWLLRQISLGLVDGELVKRVGSLRVGAECLYYVL